ncbi:MAG: hypothetical protein AB1768_06860 [Pseudomonadota bacterium]|jgi:hypothetical protein
MNWNNGSLLLGALVAAAPALAGSTFCCADASGRQVCSDILPPQCYGRAYREISERGITTRRVDAPLTPEQRARKEAELKARQEEERRLLEQRRKDMALLNTYSSEQEIDGMRDRKLADIAAGMKQIEAKRAELLKKRKQLQAETEFYRNKPLPQELHNALRTNEAELKAQDAAAEAKKQEMDAVRAKYAEEKRRYIELTGAPSASSRDAGGPR